MSCCGPQGHKHTSNDEGTASPESMEETSHGNSHPSATQSARAQNSHASCGCGGGGNWMFMAMVGVLLGLFVLGYLLR